MFTAFSIVLSYVSFKSFKGRKILDGTPVILIKNGKILNANLKKTKLTVNDLLEECRQKNVFDISMIEFAILEASGRLSVLNKSQNRNLTPRDMQISTGYEGLCVNVVIDGVVIRDSLAAIGLDMEWLKAELFNLGISHYGDVLLAYVDSVGGLHVHRKN